MKRFLILTALLCHLLTGCGIFGTRLREPVTFYYLQAEYQHGTDSPVFASEQREASGHRQDLRYLMALYLMGPTSEDLISPLPAGTRIFTAIQEGDTLTLDISDTGKTLTDIEFTLACSCLSLTCFELTEAGTVTIISGERSSTITRQSLVLTDTKPTEETQ